MKKQCLAWTILLALALMAHGQGGAPSDAKKIQGKWTPTALYMGEARLPDDTLPDFEVVFGAGTMRLKVGPDAGQCVEFRLDGSKMPKIFDVVAPERPPCDMAGFGIYELDGDTLKISIGPDAQNRPKDFSFPDGKGERLVMILRRAK